MTDVYRLTPPNGKSFLARVQFEPAAVVHSTRVTGEWQADRYIGVADLIFPEQGRFYDWDVEKVDGGAEAENP